MPHLGVVVCLATGMRQEGHGDVLHAACHVWCSRIIKSGLRMRTPSHQTGCQSAFRIGRNCCCAPARTREVDPSLSAHECIHHVTLIQFIDVAGSLLIIGMIHRGIGSPSWRYQWPPSLGSSALTCPPPGPPVTPHQSVVISARNTTV